MYILGIYLDSVLAVQCVFAEGLIQGYYTTIIKCQGHVSSWQHWL